MTSESAMLETGTVTVASATETGRRPTNEDSVLARYARAASDPRDLALIAVADGVGGHAGGDVASKIAVDVLHKAWDAFVATEHSSDDAVVRRWIVDACRSIDRGIRRHAASHPETTGMGTTLVVCLVVDDRFITAHVGDSRAYRLAPGNPPRAKPLTRDHSVSEEARQRGMDPSEFGDNPYSSAITRVLDGSESVEIDVFPPETGWARLAADDALLVCSDGLTGTLSDQAIAELWASSSDDAAACRSLIDAAIRGGSTDNVSVALAARGLDRRAAGPFGNAEAVQPDLTQSRARPRVCRVPVFAWLLLAALVVSAAALVFALVALSGHP